MNLKDLIAEVREHDRDAPPAPWDLAWPTCITTGGRYGDTIADGCPEEAAALIVCYRTAAPPLADEVERLNAENATLRAQVEEAKTRADNAYAEGLADGQTAAERECDAELKPEPDPEKVTAFKAEMGVLRDQFEETRLTLLAEQGKPEGAVSVRWRVSCGLHGFEWWRGEDDELPEVECHLSGGEWRWTKPGFESNPYPTARAAMLAADKDTP